MIRTVTRLTFELAFRNVQHAEITALFDKRSAVNGVVAVPGIIVSCYHVERQRWVRYLQLGSRSISSKDRADSLEAKAELDEQVLVQLHIGGYDSGQYQPT
jgi:hypothetical protein